ncbi:MAG: YciK family oxidoreductase [Pseudomonadota bacterium]
MTEKHERSGLMHYDAPAGLLGDRVVLITGAGDGIGRAVALAAAAAGATVILHGRTVAKLEAVYDAIVEAGGARPSIAPMDLETADGDSYASLAESIRDEFGRLDGLLHNAGILGELTPVAQYDLPLWQRVMHINVTAAVALTQVCLPLLRVPETASLLFTSSGVGRTGRAYWGAYSVSKFATEALAQVLADENRKTGIRVNVINPGATRTAMRRSAYPAEDRNALATPEDIAPAYLYLLGDDSQALRGASVDAQ